MVGFRQGGRAALSEKGFIIGSRWNTAMEGAGEVTVSEKGDLEGERSPPSHREEPGPFSCQSRAWGAERGAGRQAWGGFCL